AVELISATDAATRAVFRISLFNFIFLFPPFESRNAGDSQTVAAHGLKLYHHVRRLQGNP
ncbi:MAG: hypothetical protein R3179_11355, partial [Sedimenticolaceae bacterium]|nr:hypothetical protein [Sedimenticolaceae bacterium]